MLKGLKRKSVFLSVVGFALAAALLFPYVIMLLTALKAGTEVYKLPPTLLPTDWSFNNFTDIWVKVPLATYFKNSLFISVFTVVLALGCAIPAAYVLARLTFAGKNLYLYLIIVTQMFSPVVLVVGIYRELLWFDLINSLWGLVLVNAAFSQAFAVWIMYGFFSAIPFELEEAAWLDGCSKGQALWNVVLPLAVPALVTTTIFVFILAWNEFVIALTVISSEAAKPLTVGIYAFIGMFDTQWQYLFATSLIAAVPVVVLFLLIERYLISGLLAGGVKQ